MTPHRWFFGRSVRIYSAASSENGDCWSKAKGRCLPTRRDQAFDKFAAGREETKRRQRFCPASTSRAIGRLAPSPCPRRKGAHAHGEWISSPENRRTNKRSACETQLRSRCFRKSRTARRRIAVRRKNRAWTLVILPASLQRAPFRTDRSPPRVRSSIGDPEKLPADTF